eukprot:4206920-Pleurochrysis_carterae.AAC.1
MAGKADAGSVQLSLDKNKPGCRKGNQVDTSRHLKRTHKEGEPRQNSGLGHTFSEVERRLRPLRKHQATADRCEKQRARMQTCCKRSKE